VAVGRDPGGDPEQDRHHEHAKQEHTKHEHDQHEHHVESTTQRR
jgi:hypothetical protein